MKQTVTRSECIITLRRLGAALSVLLASVLPGLLSAQQGRVEVADQRWGAQSTDVPRRSLRLVVENDLIAVRGAGVPPDYDYTHGTRLMIAWSGAPGWIHRLTRIYRDCATAPARQHGCLAATLELGQEIYTPRHDAVLPVPGERPYSGWLYASAAARYPSAGRTRTVGVALGVTGRPSFAEQTQDAIHRLLDNQPQRGWAHQLGAEPGVVLQYDEALTLTSNSSGGRAGALALRWGAAAGNVRTAAHVGALARVGIGRRVRWSPAEPETEHPSGLSASAGWRQDFVLRNLFVDGNTFRESAGAERRAFVNQLELGVGLRRRRYAVDYRYVRRGREYRAQPTAHAFGSLGLTIHQR